MSLFQAKEWWGKRLASNEEFDDRHLLVMNIDNNEKNNENIVIGSFQGYLRIFSPQKGEYKVTHLLFEHNFNEPIIQVGGGELLSFTNQNAVAVLLFKKLIVIQFANSITGMQHKVVYQHGLERNAYNMVIGKFGKNQKDYICIQSCDGMISIYEHEQLTCTQNIKCDWRVNLGEQSLGIECIQRAQGIFDYVVLSEESMFIITQEGFIRSQKKFEYPCANFVIIDTPQKKNQLYIDKGTEQMISPLTIAISSYTHNLLIYENFKLLWATKTEHIAHALKIGQYDGTRGLITSLNDEGWLQVQYLGTNQSNDNFLFQSTVKELSYEEMDKQYSTVLENIENKEGSGNGIKNKPQQNKSQKENELMSVNLQCMGTFKSQQYVEEKEKYYQTKDGNVLATKLRISLSYQGERAQNIQINLVLPKNMVAEKNPIQLNELKGGGTPYSCEVNLYMQNNFTPYSSLIQAQVTFNNCISGQNANKDPRGTSSRIIIGPAAQSHLSPPIKNSSFKITLQANKDIPALSELFQDLVKLDCNQNIKDCLSNPNAYTFIMANEGQSVEFQFTDHIPLQDLFSQIDEHYSLRQELKKCKEQLDKKTIEFRTIQKRLLTRFKEKNPAPLNNLDLLLQKSYEDLILLANKTESIQERLQEVSHTLSVTLHLIHYLLKLRFNLSGQTFKLVQDTIPTNIINDDGDIGWEEIVNANIVFLLKVALKKENKQNNIEISKIDDFAKFKKQMAFFFDKLSKVGLIGLGAAIGGFAVYTFSKLFEPQQVKVENSTFKNQQQSDDEVKLMQKKNEKLRNIIQNLQEGKQAEEQPYDEYIRCQIGFSVMRKPVMITTCGHSFEEDNLNQYLSLKNNYKCPMCRKEFKREQIQINYSLKQMIENLVDNGIVKYD
ncbi:hypothetical protein PPERSA_10520 [Pseudocohnilembus persalinus]|uniref:RING-type domain-containing protein n=1 Tax=Pseudocohnilembus persalinus TaxID=266149 RepID=A0A0V0R853_PSEPJ|nr:hypothetical protein PPERSA_10520 [Pseudocohnilembus persalinus]|eukprot:KRX10421.1 hypothetical protein PPERSA_10520 [Pseudocohnilembus persalinus]